jgi:galactose mutarotase-like enzyme
MKQLPFIDDRWTFLTHKSVILENHALRIVVLPELGGRIWSVIYKLLDREIVWQNPRIAPQKVPFGSAFDNFWCGGWEEMFPTAATATINGEVYPDHGEVWNLSWTPRIEQGKDSVAVRLNCQTPISGLLVEKTLTLRGDKPSFELSYRVENPGLEEFPFLFALHPAMAVSEGDRIDFPDMRFEVDPSYPGALADFDAPFNWPLAPGKSAETDLRAVRPASSKEVYFLYGHDHREGWFAVTDPAIRFSAGFIFSPEVFRSCWVFASYGGWRGYHMALIEPCTSYPQQLEDAIKQSRAATLAPGGAMQTTLTFLAQEGLSSVGGITENALFRE